MHNLGGRIDEKKRWLFTLFEVLFFFCLMRIMGIRNDIAVNVVFVTMACLYALFSIYYTESPAEVVIYSGLINIMGIFISFNTIRLDRSMDLFALMFCYQMAAYMIFNKTRGKRNIVIIGDHPRKNEFVEIIEENRKYGRIVDVDEARAALLSTSQVEMFIEDKGITHICVLEELEKNVMNNLLRARGRGLKVYDYTDFYEYVEGRIPINDIEEKDVLLGRGFDIYHNLIKNRMKRNLDFALSLLLVLVSLPVHLFLLSKGTLKRRVAGANDKSFTEIRYRSSNETIEKLGMIWNVIRGDMSLIGPEGEEAEAAKHYSEKVRYYSMKSSIKPGIIGWKQLNYRYNTSETDKKMGLMYDLYYIKHHCLALDITIGVKWFLKKLGINY